MGVFTFHLFNADKTRHYPHSFEMDNGIGLCIPFKWDVTQWGYFLKFRALCMKIFGLIDLFDFQFKSDNDHCVLIENNDIKHYVSNIRTSLDEIRDGKCDAFLKTSDVIDTSQFQEYFKMHQYDGFYHRKIMELQKAIDIMKITLRRSNEKQMIQLDNTLIYVNALCKIYESEHIDFMELVKVYNKLMFTLSTNKLPRKILQLYTDCAMTAFISDLYNFGHGLLKITKCFINWQTADVSFELKQMACELKEN